MADDAFTILGVIMNPVVILVLSSFLIMGGLMVAIIARRVILMKTGDKVEAKIVSLEKNRTRVNEDDNIYHRYEYLINVVYSYKDQGYAENIKLNRATMNTYLPHLANLNGLYDGGGAVMVDDKTIPIVVDPKKPTRIIANFDQLLAETYPESFGTQNQSKNDENVTSPNPPTQETNQNQNNHSSYHNPYDLSDSNDD